ncbi:MAG: type II toxin-antitoxin system RelE/ParE family toxin [Alphaproteobacteria bacterium]
MIIHIKHKGLRLLYQKGDRSKLSAKYIDKIERVLARLDQAEKPEDMNLPSYRLHPLVGNFNHYWAISISANMRVIFRFEQENITDIDLIDYH